MRCPLPSNPQLFRSTVPHSRCFVAGAVGDVTNLWRHDHQSAVLYGVGYADVSLGAALYVFPDDGLGAGYSRSLLRGDDRGPEHEGNDRWSAVEFSFARAWMRWYGGLGIVVLSLALVMQPGLAAKGLAVTEAESDDLVGGTRAHARRVLKVYGVLTAVSRKLTCNYSR